MNVLYLLISHGELSSNFARSTVVQKFCIIEKIKICNVENMFFKVQYFHSFRKMALRNVRKLALQLLVYGVSNIMRRKKSGFTLFLFYLCSKIPGV